MRAGEALNAKARDFNYFNSANAHKMKPLWYVGSRQLSNSVNTEGPLWSGRARSICERSGKFYLLAAIPSFAV